MEKKVLAHANIMEVSMAGNAFILNFNDYAPKQDEYLQNLIHRLKKELETLQPSLCRTRTEPLTDKLRQSVQELVNSQIGLRYFVKAFQYDLDEDVKSSAQRIWHVVNSKVKRLNIEYKQSYADQIILKLKSEKYATDIAKIIGMPQRLTQYEICANKMRDYYREKNTALNSRKKIIPGNISAKNIRNLINDHILPYVDTMNKIKPDEFSLVYKNMMLKVKNLNQDVRIRRKQNARKRKEINDSQNQ